MSRGARTRGLAILGASVLWTLGAGASVTWARVGSAPFPAPTGTAQQGDFEPGIARDASGRFWVAGTSYVERGADLWTSLRGGRSFRFVASPFHTTSYDVDVAAASEADAAGKQAVYVANQETNGDTLIGTSLDRGKTWTTTNIGGVPEQDRPWLAADGACTLYASYYDPDAGHAWVNRYSTCAGTPALTQRVPTLLTRVPDPYSAGASIFGGKIVVDTSPSSPFRHSVYIPTGGCAVLPSAEGIFFPPTPAVAEDCQALPVANSISISRDGGLTWRAIHIADAPTHQMSIWPDQLAVAPDGTLYQVWDDQRSAYVARSTTGGESWDEPTLLPAPGAAVLPEVAAGPNGSVAVAFYAADRAGFANDKEAMSGAGWHLTLDTSRDGGHTWKTGALPNLLWVGPVCTTTHFCSGPGKGASPFLEDFGVAMNRSGLSFTAAFADPRGASGAGPASIEYATEPVR